MSSCRSWCSWWTPRQHRTTWQAKPKNSMQSATAGLPTPLCCIASAKVPLGGCAQGGLEHFIFPYIGKTNPNWRTHIFQRGRYTTNRYISIYYIYRKLALLELATWPTCTGAPPVTNLWWLIPSWPVATGPLVTWLVRRRLEQTLRSFGWADAEIARNCWDVGVPWAGGPRSWRPWKIFDPNPMNPISFQVQNTEKRFLMKWT